MSDDFSTKMMEAAVAVGDALPDGVYLVVKGGTGRLIGASNVVLVGQSTFADTIAASKEVLDAQLSVQSFPFAPTTPVNPPGEAP